MNNNKYYNNLRTKIIQEGIKNKEESMEYQTPCLD